MFRLEALSTPLETEVDNLGPVKALDEPSTLNSAMIASTNLVKDFMMKID